MTFAVRFVLPLLFVFVLLSVLYMNVYMFVCQSDAFIRSMFCLSHSTVSNVCLLLFLLLLLLLLCLISLARYCCPLSWSLLSCLLLFVASCFCCCCFCCCCRRCLFAVRLVVVKQWQNIAIFSLSLSFSLHSQLTITQAGCSFPVPVGPTNCVHLNLFNYLFVCYFFSLMPLAWSHHDKTALVQQCAVAACK